MRVRAARALRKKVALDLPYNQAVDTYSLAMIIWEMVYRKKPFSGMNVELHRTAVCMQGVRPPLERRLAPPDLVALLGRSWHADMDRRPPLAAVAAELHAMRAAAEAQQQARGGRGASGGGWLLRSKFLSFGRSSASSWF